MSKLAAIAPPGALPAGAMLGRYELLGLLSVGGMAEIYLARTAGIAGFEKLIVIKRMLPHFAMQPTFVEMFLAEARLGAMLDHPNVTAVHDIGEETGNYYYAMEYVRGADLRRIMKAAARDHGAMPLHCAIAIGLGMCAGLDHAHGLTDSHGHPLGVVHRDVTLSNVLVSYAGTVKVTDFGVAKLTASEQRTRTGTLKGKIGYMSPEQCRGDALDRRSDIFAIGIVLYELTTGKRLFRSQHGELEVLQRIVGEDVAPPSRQHPEYPMALEEIVMRALKRDREERYPTARDLQRDLESLVVTGRLAATPFELGEYVRATVPVPAMEIEAAAAHPPSLPSARISRARLPDVCDTDDNPAVVTARSAELALCAPTPARRWGRVALILVGSALVGVSFAMVAILSFGTARRRPPTPAPAAIAKAERDEPTPPVRATPAPARETRVRAPARTAEPPPTPPKAPVEAVRPAPTPIDRGRDRKPDRKPDRPAVRTAPMRGVELDAGTPQAAPPDAAPPEARHVDEPPPEPRHAVAPPEDDPPDPAPAPARAERAVTRADLGPGSLDAVPSVSSITVNGPLGDSEIRRGVKRVLSAFRACYREAAGAAGKTPSAKVKLTFRIDGTRAARKVGVSGTSLPGLGACVADAASRIRTRIAPDVGDAHVTVGVTFDPTEP